MKHPLCSQRHVMTIKATGFPYDCDSKRKYPNAVVFECLECRSWTHEHDQDNWLWGSSEVATE